MSYTKEQFDRLPKWAQIEISVLESNINSLKVKVSEFMGETKTNTYISEGLDSRPLPYNSRIEFKTGERQEHALRVYIMDDGVINMNASSRTAKDMVILPRASNSFYIKFIDRD